MSQTSQATPTAAPERAPAAPSRRRQARERRRALVEGLPRRTALLAEDAIRANVSLLPMVVAALVVNPTLPRETSADAIVYYMATFGGFLVCYAVLTLVAFVGLRGTTLRRALALSKRRAVLRRETSRLPFLYRRQRPDDVGGDGAMWPVFLAIIALLAVLALLVDRGLRSDVAGVVSTVMLVTGAWGGTLIAYALHLARMDHKTGGLRFPGDPASPGDPAASDDPGGEDRVFGDYLYLGLTTQVSFGPGDVAVIAPRMRRTIAGHMFISYLFNTLVVAMMVSLLVSVAA
ncbi:DUF1345 domain-containing protein [Aestuariimicrobium sp. Y1814]|uniref:DUF1345 domain-containing protein n=1 Tax=Aestuariimicrobium sp. Y1814 TaxID=3418742 RepID=UPI003DA7124E